MDPSSPRKAAFTFVMYGVCGSHGFNFTWALDSGWAAGTSCTSSLSSSSSCGISLQLRIKHGASGAIIRGRPHSSSSIASIDLRQRSSAARDREQETSALIAMCSISMHSISRDSIACSASICFLKALYFSTPYFLIASSVGISNMLLNSSFQTHFAMRDMKLSKQRRRHSSSSGLPKEAGNCSETTAACTSRVLIILRMAFGRPKKSCAAENAPWNTDFV
mmetsp:Transcript_102552/g.289646  ORF Transcript_102552/g.289646 Transcript_102552/m.289646 type:complete len:221 (+) Transcript_102552:1534-2196(+)